MRRAIGGWSPIPILVGVASQALRVGELPQERRRSARREGQAPPVPSQVAHALVDGQRRGQRSHGACGSTNRPSVQERMRELVTGGGVHGIKVAGRNEFSNSSAGSGAPRRERSAATPAPRRHGNEPLAELDVEAAADEVPGAPPHVQRGARWATSSSASRGWPAKHMPPIARGEEYRAIDSFSRSAAVACRSRTAAESSMTPTCSRSASGRAW